MRACFVLVNIYVYHTFLFKKNHHICSISNWEKQQEVKKEGRERDRSRRETLGKYFYDLSKLMFAAIVLGEMLILQKDMSDSISWLMILFGGLLTYLLAWIGNKILK